jgi:hypothetical protein
MIILRNRNFSLKYDPRTGKYEGKYSPAQRIGTIGITSGIGAVGGFTLGALTGNSRVATSAAKIGAGLGAATGMYLARNKRIDKINKAIDERNNNYRKNDFSRRTKNLPISYKEFLKKYPSQARQLKDLEDLGYYSDENPGDIEWFEDGGLEKGRYLPISSDGDYSNLMFDTKTGKYVSVDSEMLEPEEVKDIKSWVKYQKY